MKSVIVFVGAALELAAQDAAHLVLRQPGKDRLADGRRVRRSDLADAAGVDADRMPRLADGEHHDASPCTAAR